MTMDPSLNGRRTGAKSGFDCTRRSAATAKFH